MYETKDDTSFATYFRFMDYTDRKLGEIAATSAPEISTSRKTEAMDELHSRALDLVRPFNRYSTKSIMSSIDTLLGYGFDTDEPSIKIRLEELQARLS